MVVPGADIVVYARPSCFHGLPWHFLVGFMGSRGASNVLSYWRFYDALVNSHGASM